MKPLTPLRARQKGAAILTAMLLVTLVATLSATALWQQWRGIEIETAERSRVQSAWIQQGALDWARLLLREDVRTLDHLGEPWAVGLQEARLATFLASQSDAVVGTGLEDGLTQAFLSGRIEDLQARLNVTSLLQPNGQEDKPTVAAFTRLFASLQLPPDELSTMVRQLKLAVGSEADTPAASDPGGGQGSAAAPTKPKVSNIDGPLLPRTVDQLAWLGLSRTSIAALAPYITVLKERTPVNLNTASALVLAASIKDLPLSEAQRMLTARAQAPFQTLEDAKRAIPALAANLLEGQHSVNTRHFEIHTQLRLDALVSLEDAVVQRNAAGEVRVLWRQRGTQLLNQRKPP
ncbi:type II secretion system minor pseudopilin GspK [Rhodoferax aquaticus]|uniref:Type II secretion system protein K n=1 Tax=Rhodoferax aquaticus TaxID=2527691 RepID=A0A515ELF6_9BURK|nr:type II secretion system minor pseudopilin GspK [Rhodoferax aquaticus]QDL53488.1 general secretion pathway protein GspK [Rhodoferax aquaticus]